MKSKTADKKHDVTHASHAEVLLRLKRGSGHLQKVVQMVDENKPCADVLQQLNAVIAALSATRVLVLQDHLNSCIKPALKSGKEHMITEIQKVIERAIRV